MQNSLYIAAKFNRVDQLQKYLGGNFEYAQSSDYKFEYVFNF